MASCMFQNKQTKNDAEAISGASSILTFRLQKKYFKIHSLDMRTPMAYRGE